MKNAMTVMDKDGRFAVINVVLVSVSGLLSEAATHIAQVAVAVIHTRIGLKLVEHVAEKAIIK